MSFEVISYRTGLDQDYYPSVEQGAVNLGLEPIEVTPDVLEAKIKEINSGYAIIWGPNGRNYEVCVLNPENSDRGIIARPSTGFSSLLKNPANALELAYLAVANPEYAHLYVASFGNKPTKGMLIGDLLHTARTGRYSRGDGTPNDPYTPLSSVEDLVEALDVVSMIPTHFSANAEAGRLALAMMGALKPGSVQGVYLNGLDGISGKKGYAGPKLTEDAKSRVERRTKEQPIGVATPASIKRVKDLVPEIYSGMGRITHMAPLTLAICFKDLVHKGFVYAGVRGHNDLDNLTDHAVYNDFLSAVSQQPNSAITMRFNRQSGIHDIDDCIRFGKFIMSSAGSLNLELLIGDGGLDDQQLDPENAILAERIAFAI